MWLTQGNAEEVPGNVLRPRPLAALAELSQTSFEFHCFCSKAKPL
jgi:hypothetical protein